MPLSLSIVERASFSEAAALFGSAELPPPRLPTKTAPKTARPAPESDESDSDEYWVPQKPKRRSECVDGPRPCPWVSCRYNLYLDIRADGVLRINFPDRDPEEMAFSCALDLAADGPRTLDQVAGLMGMSRERARQIEEKVLAAVRGEYEASDFGDDLL
jgi:hypothetical protein